MFATLQTATAESEATTLLLPKPHVMSENGSHFSLTRDVKLTDATGSTLLASLFSTSTDAEATVIVKLVDAATLGTFDYDLAGFDNEGYKLSVSDNNITIVAASPIGVIRAAQTLMQLSAATGGTFIPGVDITDYPAFKLRGFMHDVGRSFISFDELKKEIDLLSRFKVNVFHWHLTDNQGFRFESKKYPQLNRAANMTRFAGKYYTQAQCTELEAFAAERGVTIIPEIDMPGHSKAFATAMGYTMNSNSGKAALKKLLTELANAFPLAPYIHIGCDEAGTTADFVNEMSQYIKETLGRKCIVWNPISGVTINKGNLPYIDMTEMWSTAGRKIDGLPNIDCRYNYINHFDVFADLVGIYKSNVYYAQQGNEEIAGAITAIWNDRKTPSETDIIEQNNLYACALATSERGWMGGGKRYIEVGGVTLPASGREFKEFADWERRFLHYKSTWLAGEPIPYVKQTNVRWRITEPFPNDGDASMAFPPETATNEILPEEFTYKGKTYHSNIATGTGIYLRHVWGTQVPAFYTNPAINNTAYAWTYVYSPVQQTVGALIEFQNYSRSENDKAPDTGKWDRKGSRIWINDTEVMPPTWTNSGKTINSEIDLRNENFPAREPFSITLNAGWNKVFIKLPYVSANGVRLNKWMFTFVLTDPTGTRALDEVIYSPSQSMDATADIPAVLSDEPLSELEGHDILVDSKPASELQVGQWYVMFDRGRTGNNAHGYLYENAATHTLYNTATVPSGHAEDACRYLVRLVDATGGKYFIQTGFGNYFGPIAHKTNVATTPTASEPITVAKIGGASGHFYLQSSSTGVILDANSLEHGDATVVGWNTNIPTTTGGNNDWAFYPVQLVKQDLSICMNPEDVVVVQGHQTTGQGNTMQALLRVKLTPSASCTPTRVDINLVGGENINRVEVYSTSIDQIHADGANPVKLGEATIPNGGGALTIPITNTSHLLANKIVYLWITADISNTATELATVDASIKSISYTPDSAADDSSEKTCDITSIGNPDGVMLIFKQQTALWTASQSKTKYYRIPTIINTADGGIAAFTDYRYDNTEDLGKPTSGHKIDVVMRKSSDNGLTWSAETTVAAGDGSSDAAYGYGDPAVVRTNSGKLICLMAAGRNSYSTGMLHMGYIESKDNGVTWSRPKDIYSRIRRNGVTFQSLFTTAGKGVTFSNGRVAFAMNGKVGGTTNAYILYSDDEGSTWHVMPQPVFTGGDESKLEIMNDNSLLLSVRRGSWNGIANRGYNRSLGDASGSDLSNWGTQGIWGNEMRANGCNADILYYNRSVADTSIGDHTRPDVILHTLTKDFSTYRRDLRLYMSFDQGATWKEAFKLQPGYAAYSSMQKLANGDLAIIYEDGSIGNQDKMDCFAINYIVISSETLNARIDELCNRYYQSIEPTMHDATNITDQAAKTLYDIIGRKVAKSEKELSRLAKGVYISNGRKLLLP